MKRYDTRIADGQLEIEWDGDWLAVGEMADIYDSVGGRTYDIAYDERQRMMDWVDAPDGTMTIDVRDTIADMTYDESFVSQLANAPLDEATGAGVPKRTALFADLMTRIWDSKGSLEENEA